MPKRIQERDAPTSNNLTRFLEKLLIKQNCWIYVSQEVRDRIDKDELSFMSEFSSPNTLIYTINDEVLHQVQLDAIGDSWFFVTIWRGNKKWNNAHPKASDPEIIYFIK